MQQLNQPIPWAAGLGESFELMCHCMISGRTLGDALRLAERFDKQMYPSNGYRVCLLEDTAGPQVRLGYTFNLSAAGAGLIPADWDRADSKLTVARSSVCGCGMLCVAGLLANLSGQLNYALMPRPSARNTTTVWSKSLMPLSTLMRQKIPSASTGPCSIDAWYTLANRSLNFSRTACITLSKSIAGQREYQRGHQSLW